MSVSGACGFHQPTPFLRVFPAPARDAPIRCRGLSVSTDGTAPSCIASILGWTISSLYHLTLLSAALGGHLTKRVLVRELLGLTQNIWQLHDWATCTIQDYCTSVQSVAKRDGLTTVTSDLSFWVWLKRSQGDSPCRTRNHYVSTFKVHSTSSVTSGM